jgi:hypothetical protein
MIPNTTNFTEIEFVVSRWLLPSAFLETAGGLLVSVPLQIDFRISLDVGVTTTRIA